MQTLAAALLAIAVAAPVTREQLANFTYALGESSSVEGGKVPLAGGRWADAEGGSTFTLHPAHALGDLDGDGQADGAAIVVEHAGGTGSFYYLFAVLARDGAAVQAGEPEWLGDRTKIEGLSIDRQGILTVRYLTHGDDDPACCPTMKITDRYRVREGKLIGITK